MLLHATGRKLWCLMPPNDDGADDAETLANNPQRLPPDVRIKPARGRTSAALVCDAPPPASWFSCHVQKRRSGSLVWAEQMPGAVALCCAPDVYLHTSNPHAYVVSALLCAARVLPRSSDQNGFLFLQVTSSLFQLDGGTQLLPARHASLTPRTWLCLITCGTCCKLLKPTRDKLPHWRPSASALLIVIATIRTVRAYKICCS